MVPGKSCIEYSIGDSVYTKSRYEKYKRGAVREKRRVEFLVEEWPSPPPRFALLECIK
jgi:hypothetical protein